MSDAVSGPISESAADSTSVESTPAVVDLLGILAHGELAAFDRMATDARLAPDVTRQAVLSEMAGHEIANYQRIAARLAELGVDPAEAMAPFRAGLDAYHNQTEPSDWLEALTKAYVGDSIADDFFREIAQLLTAPDKELVLDVVHDSRYADYAAAEIRSALAADPTLANRLSMWARRLVGEALTQAQRIAAERSSVAELILRDVAERADSASGIAALFTRLTSAHLARMASVGLNT